MSEQYLKHKKKIKKYYQKNKEEIKKYQKEYQKEYKIKRKKEIEAEEKRMKLEIKRTTVMVPVRMNREDKKWHDDFCKITGITIQEQIKILLEKYKEQVECRVEALQIKAKNANNVIDH